MNIRIKRLKDFSYNEVEDLFTESFMYWTVVEELFFDAYKKPLNFFEVLKKEDYTNYIYHYILELNNKPIAISSTYVFDIGLCKVASFRNLYILLKFRGSNLSKKLRDFRLNNLNQMDVKFVSLRAAKSTEEYHLKNGWTAVHKFSNLMIKYL